ncbi:unnamed protein product [Angiostrongylus costaricensis]|uniref:Peroxisomal acyl-coenzyme A oxidase 3 n=1 Tax=Angiostrongylus costaricensis TaxID=334426 RepID=A0A0R3PNS1_ANGCS|nr:unnamed protein product [Angiostrongylus costaricensis]
MTASPLDSYRQKASFNWSELKDIVEGQENVQIKKRLYETLEKEPLFARNYDRLSREELRELNHRRWKKILELKLPCDQFGDYQAYHCLLEVLDMYDQGLSARLSLHSTVNTLIYCILIVFITAIFSMGSERHQEILERARRNEIVGCFSLTELSHGSNTQEIQTVATLDNGEFVFNCPNDGAIKDTRTFEPLPGITIGDMGEKPGAWNGVENGWMEFKNHRAPLWTLLNKGCEVTSDGNYISSYKSASEKQSISLGALSVGR